MRFSAVAYHLSNAADRQSRRLVRAALAVFDLHQAHMPMNVL